MSSWKWSNLTSVGVFYLELSQSTYLFWSYSSIHQHATLQVFAGTEPHSVNIQFCKHVKDMFARLRGGFVNRLGIWIQNLVNEFTEFFLESAVMLFEENCKKGDSKVGGKE